MYIRTNIASLIPLLSAMALTSACGQGADTPLPENGATDEVQLSFSACISGDVTPAGRGTVEGDRFPANSTPYIFGTWICLHEDDPKDFTAAKNGYSNLRTEMRATGSGDGYREEWSYVFEDRPHTTLNVSRGIPIDIYTFHPRPQTGIMAARPDAVPFTSGQTDWLWSAISVESDELRSDKKTVKLRFSHAMTCLEIRIKSLYSGSKLTSITLEDKKMRLYKSGYMNLARQELVLDETKRSGSIMVTYGTLLTTSEKSFQILIPPVEGYEDGDFTLSFIFDGNPAKTQFSIPGRMDNGAAVSEFARGRRYIYNLTLDNHTRFEPAGVDDQWLTNDYELIL